jgi:hypothetical protein
MRAILIPFSALFIMAAQVQAIEWDTLNPSPGPASFSIGYPKGWQVYEAPAPQRQDLFFNNPCPPHVYVIFGTGSTNLHDIASYTISCSSDETAKEADEKSIADMRRLYGDGRLSTVKTSAGDSGWLLERKGCGIAHPVWLANDPSWPVGKNILSDLPQKGQSQRPSIKISIVYHDFFFRSNSPGNQAGIYVEIMTNAADSSRRAELDQLVLQTLRFNNN